MSRSNKSNNSSGSSNPCKIFIEWKNGEFTYYDRDKESNVSLGHKITFLVLDNLSTIKGWDEKSSSSIYSNEVRDTREDILKVRSFKGGDMVSGLYSDIKDKVSSLGGNYYGSTYVAMKIDGHLTLCNIQLKGATLWEWSEFKSSNSVELYTKAVVVTGFEDRKKGAIKYKVPVFSLGDVSEKTDKEATKLDEVLQEYLEEYLGSSSTTSPKKVVDVDEGVNQEEEVEDDLPF